MTEQNRKEVLKDIEVMISSCILQGKFVEEDAEAILNHIIKTIANTYKIDFSNIKASDKVWSIQYGKGIVYHKSGNCIKVLFENFSGSEFTHNYYRDGRYNCYDRYPSLFKVNPFEVA